MPTISPYPKPRRISFYVIPRDSFSWSYVDCSTSLQCALKQMLCVHGLLVHRPRPRASTKPRFIPELCHTWVLRESCPPGAGIHSPVEALQIRPYVCALEGLTLHTETLATQELLPYEYRLFWKESTAWLGSLCQCDNTSYARQNVLNCFYHS